MWTVWGHSSIKLRTETKLEVFTAFVWNALWLHLLLLFSLNESRRTCCCTATPCVVIVFLSLMPHQRLYGYCTVLFSPRRFASQVPTTSPVPLVSNCFVEKQHLNNFSSNLVSKVLVLIPPIVRLCLWRLLLLALAVLLMCVWAPRARSLQCVHACLPSFSVVCSCLHGWIQIGLSSLWLQMLYEYDFTPPTLSVFPHTDIALLLAGFWCYSCPLTHTRSH